MNKSHNPLHNALHSISLDITRYACDTQNAFNKEKFLEHSVPAVQIPQTMAFSYKEELNWVKYVLYYYCDFIMLIRFSWLPENCRFPFNYILFCNLVTRYVTINRKIFVQFHTMLKLLNAAILKLDKQGL